MAETGGRLVAGPPRHLELRLAAARDRRVAGVAKTRLAVQLAVDSLTRPSGRVSEPTEPEPGKEERNAKEVAERLDFYPS